MIVNRFTPGIINTELPAFTYTGNYTVVDDGTAGWRIKFLTNGTLTLENPRLIDVFCVGGGSSGTYGTGSSKVGGLGGAGGYTKTKKSIFAVPNTSYPITIGDGGASVYASSGGMNGKSGGKTSAFGVDAAGGEARSAVVDGSTLFYPGNGGSGGGEAGFYVDVNNDTKKVNGGRGGSDGSNGYEWVASGSSVVMALLSNNYTGGQGQRSTTREFGEATGDLYAGGGGGCAVHDGFSGGSGGAGGGGHGGAPDVTPTAGTANTGGGGGAGAFLATPSKRKASGAGGSGIVVIRNHRE